MPRTERGDILFDGDAPAYPVAALAARARR
jgi:hypothetical protein